MHIVHCKINMHQLVSNYIFRRLTLTHRLLIARFMAKLYCAMLLLVLFTATTSTMNSYKIPEVVYENFRTFTMVIMFGAQC